MCTAQTRDLFAEVAHLCPTALIQIMDDTWEEVVGEPIQRCVDLGVGLGWDLDTGSASYVQDFCDRQPLQFCTEGMTPD